MLHFFWGILNLFLLLYFLIVVFKSFNFIRKNISGFASLVYIIGILSIFSVINENSTEKNNYTKSEFENIKQTSIQTENHWLTNYVVTFFIGYNSESKAEKIIQVKSTITGFVSGINYEQNTQIINKLNDNTFSYEIYGVEKWKLIGITIYTNDKAFFGKFNLK